MILKKKLLQASGVYLVTDRQALKGKDVISTLAHSVNAGIDIIQYRDKEATDREFIEIGRKIKNLIKRKNVLFIVNDRVDLALRLDSDGVHLGQDDIDVELARKILGRKKIIGLSTHSIIQLRKASKTDVDYISIGPVFSTSTKPGYKAIGLGPVKIAATQIKKPVVAIGGIDRSNIKDVVSAGARRVAVVTAILSSEDPFLATKDLIGKLKSDR